MKHKCLFGCRGTPRSDRDCLRHYLLCRPLWTLLCTVSQAGASAIDVPIGGRLGFVRPTQLKCILIAGLFRTYHGFKKHYLHTVPLSREGTLELYGDVHETMSRLIKYHWNELRASLTFSATSYMGESSPGSTDRRP